MATPRIPRDPASRRAARPAARGRRSRPASAISRTARYRGIDPLSGLRLRRAWPAADHGPHRGVQRALPERPIGPQISAVSGPLARTIGDIRIALAAMSARDYRDPWWVPAPLEGPAMPKRVAMCLNPDGLDPVPEVKAAVADAGKRLARAAGSSRKSPTRRRCARPPICRPKLWLGDGYEAQLEMAEREGDPGALACLRGNRAKVHPFDLSKTLTRRLTLTREWLAFFENYAVLLMPVSGELPFPDQLDRKDEASFARVWHAQLPQIAIPFMGLPGLTVSTGLVGRVPVGVQLVSGRYREDLCLAAGEAIEAGGTPSAAIDPAG
jgi:amidase